MGIEGRTLCPFCRSSRITSQGLGTWRCLSCNKSFPKSKGLVQTTPAQPEVETPPPNMGGCAKHGRQVFREINGVLYCSKCLDLNLLEIPDEDEKEELQDLNE